MQEVTRSWRSGPGRLARWSASLKVRLAVLCVLVIAASVLTAAWLVLSRAREQTADILRQAETANAERMAGIVGQRVKRLQAALRAAAEAVPVGRFDEPGALDAYMRQRQVLSTLFATLTLVDTAGDVLVARDESGVRFPKINLIDRPHIRSSLEHGLPAVSEPVIGRLTTEAMLYFTMPVLDGDQRVVAVLNGGLRLSSRDLLTDLVMGGGGQPDGTSRRILAGGDQVETVIVDARGTVLAHPNGRMVTRPVREDAGVAAAWRAALSSVESGASGAPAPSGQGAPVARVDLPGGADGENGDLIVAAAAVPELRWVVLRMAPARQMLAGFDAASRQATIVALAVAVLGAGVILLWLVWLLRPLDQLERRARALTPDDPDPQAGWPEARGEIGALVRALRDAVHQGSLAQAHTASLLGKMRSMLHTAPIGIAFTRERRFELVSERLCALLGYGSDELVGEHAAVIYASKGEYEALGPRVRQAFAAGQEFVADCEFARRDGSHFIGELRGQPVDAQDPTAGTIWLLRDVTAERAAHRELAWSASHDALTGLANRRQFEAELQRLLPQVRPEAPAAALFIDLDRFKQINDTAGHAAGDQVLREVAVALAANVRRDEMVARLGGDEFVIVLTACDFDAATRVAEKVRAAVERIEIRFEGRLLPVGASIGVVPIPPEGASVAGVLQVADQACYAAKSEGRNRVHADAQPRPARSGGLAVVASPSLLSSPDAPRPPAA